MVQKDLLPALIDRQKKEDDMVEAQGALATANWKIYVAQDDTERAKVEVKKAQEEVARAKDKAAKAKEGKKEVEGEILLLAERIRALEADLSMAKNRYAEARSLALDYAAAKGVAIEVEKKTREELEKERSHANALALDVD